ncbi:MAG TPA: hypothetical protein VJN18_03150 [Polyangiaceae bacterium]|nr:hypothetical protein [Polyangiaceae bacterium]
MGWWAHRRTYRGGFFHALTVGGDLDEILDHPDDTPASKHPRVLK